MGCKFLFNFSHTGSKPVLKAVGEGEVGAGEKYDNYLTKLQNICTEQEQDTKPVYETMKTAIQSMSALPTPAQ